MRSSALILILAAAGCSKDHAPPAASASAAPAASRPAPASTPKPAPAPAPPAAATKLELAAWGSLDGATPKPVALQGPFATLDAACTAIKQPTADGFCEHQALDTAPALAAPFTGVEQVKATNPDDARPDDPTQGDDQTSHWPVVSAAVQTKAGWYVATSICYSANYTSCELHAQVIGDKLVLAYDSSEATEGRWGSEDEHGLIACAAAGDGAVSCTPKIALARSTASTEHRDDPGGKQEVQFACAGDLRADGHLIIGELPASDPAAKASPKGACAKLAYAGDHAVAF